MKKKYSFVICFVLLLQTAFAQNTPGKVERTLQKADNAVNKGKAIVNVFQPYLLKARELYAQAKQMVKEVKATAKNTKNNTGNSNGNDMPVVNESNANAGSYNNAGATPADPAAGYPSSNTVHLPHPQQEQHRLMTLLHNTECIIITHPNNICRWPILHR